MKLSDCKNLRFALEINSIYDISFWGLTNYLDILNPDIMKPIDFWGRAMELLRELGFSGFEMSFGPGNYQSALQVYSTAAAFQHALAVQGLTLVSGFYNGLFDDKPCSADYTGKWKRPERQQTILDEVSRYADFLGEAGSKIMTIGLPMRKAWNDPEPEFIDAEFYERLADLLHQIGYRIQKCGVRLALHPEGNSSFWTRRDIEMLLGFTDPMYVDFCPDTGNMRAAGDDPAEVVRNHVSRMTVFHWKDCTACLPWNMPTDGIVFQKHVPYFTTIGKGIMNHRHWMEMLRDVEYQSWAILELPSGEHFQDIRYAVNYIEEKLLQIYN